MSFWSTMANGLGVLRRSTTFSLGKQLVPRFGVRFQPVGWEGWFWGFGWGDGLRVEGCWWIFTLGEERVKSYFDETHAFERILTATSFVWSQWPCFPCYASLYLDLQVDWSDQGSPTMQLWAYVAAKINGQLWCFQFGRTDTVDGSEILRSPVEVGSLCHDLPGFAHPRWLAGFLIHQQYLWDGFLGLLFRTTAETHW